MSFKLALREFQLWFSGNLNNIRGFFRANLFCLIKKFLVNDKSVLVAFYLAGKTNPISKFDEIEPFTTSDYFRIPRLNGYRYSIKQAWRYFPELRLIARIEKQVNLREDERILFRKGKGKNTLGIKPNDLRCLCSKLVDKHSNLFMLDVIGEGRLPEFVVKNREIKKTIGQFAQQYSQMFKFLRSTEASLNCHGSRLLEIGYTSGGYSLFGFEKLGFEVSGIDNGYDGIEHLGLLPDVLKRRINSDVNFIAGDITTKTMFPENNFDVIFSSSVLEHIQNIEKAFSEMYRILSPNGVIIHNYHPYHCHDGGHALGIGDSPWAHTMCSQSDYLDYLKKFRPYEMPVANSWMKTALNRNLTLNEMQRQIYNAGFRLILWKTRPSPDLHLNNLTSDIINRSMNVNSAISINDLMTNSVSFVAKKA